MTRPENRKYTAAINEEIIKAIEKGETGVSLNVHLPNVIKNHYSRLGYTVYDNAALFTLREETEPQTIINWEPQPLPRLEFTREKMECVLSKQRFNSDRTG